MARLEHVGIAIDDVHDAVHVLSRLLGESAYRVEQVEADGVRTHFVWGGAAKLELLEPFDEASPIRRFLEKRGAGLHHLAFEVADIHAMHTRARASGFEPVDPVPRQGADGKLIFFLHPRQTAGVLIEFCQSLGAALVPAEMPAGSPIRRLSVAGGSSTRAPCVYVFEGEPSIDPERLAARLCPSRTVYAANVTPPLQESWLFEALNVGEAHAVIDRLPTPDALGMDGRLRSLIFLDPTEGTVLPFRGVGSDALAIVHSSAESLRRAASLRAEQPGLRLAATSDPELRVAIIASHVEAADSRNAP